MIKTYGNHVFNFAVGSNKALVDGKEKTLKKKITLVDGLVMLPITFIYDEADYEYEKSDKRLEVYVRGVKVENNPEEEKPYRYEFNSPGNTEGWAAVFVNLVSVLIQGNFYALNTVEHTAFRLSAFLKVVENYTCDYTVLGRGGKLHVVVNEGGQVFFHRKHISAFC